MDDRNVASAMSLLRSMGIHSKLLTPTSGSTQLSDLGVTISLMTDKSNNKTRPTFAGRVYYNCTFSCLFCGSLFLLSGFAFRCNFTLCSSLSCLWSNDFVRHLSICASAYNLFD